jgi:hypothetical protein
VPQCLQPLKSKLCSGCKYCFPLLKFICKSSISHQFFIIRRVIKYIIWYYKLSWYYFVYRPNLCFFLNVSRFSLKKPSSGCCKMYFWLTFYHFISTNAYLYHILVDNIAKILPCDKTVSFVKNNKGNDVHFKPVSQQWLTRAEKQVN